jgi:hypothetical protein
MGLLCEHWWVWACSGVPSILNAKVFTGIY